MQTEWSRRHMLKVAGTVLLGGAAVACSSAPPSGAGTSGGGSSGGGTSSSGGSGTAGGATTGSSAGATLKPVTLNVYLPKRTTSPSPGDDVVFAAVNKIVQAKINATVNFHVVPTADYKTKMPTQLAAGGSDIDLMAVGGNLMPYISAAQKGAFAPLDDLLPQYGKGIVEATPKAVLEAPSVKGKIYALTQLQLLTLQPSWQIQRRVLEASGVKGKETDGVFTPDVANPYAMDVIVPILAGAKKNLTNTSSTFTLLGYPGRWGQQTAFNPLSYGLWPITPTLHSEFPFYVKMGTSQVTMGLDEIKRFATMMRSFYQAGYMKSDAGTNAQPPVLPAEDYGVYFSWSGAGALAGYGTPPPGQPADQANLIIPLGPTPFYMGFNTGWAIPSSSTQAERTMMLLNLMYTDKDLLMLLSYGFEGTDYTITDDVVTVKDGATYADGLSCWAWGNCFITPTWPYAATSSLRGPNFWPQVESFLKSAVVSPLSAFAFDQTPVSAQWSGISAAAAAYALPLFTGSVDIGKQFADYSNAMKTAGGDAVVQQIQSQLDAYLGKNPDQKEQLLSTTYDKLMAMSPIIPGAK